MKNYNISLIKGDGIGPEIVDEAIKVLDAVAAVEDFSLNYNEYLMGGAAIDVLGVPLPDETLEASANSDAILFGAVGGEKWLDLPRSQRPEMALLKIRKKLGLYANFCPIRVYDSLMGASNLKEEVISGVDLLLVRELIGGLYFGEPKEYGEEKAYNTMLYTKQEIQRVAVKAFEIAMKRKKQLCSVDKANILEVSQFWRDTVEEVSKDFPEVSLTHMYVDSAAKELIANPKQFDVILNSNMFGDILSSEASMISGSVGLLPSASIGEKVSFYEPIHGSNPDIAGQGIANPIATILSASMMLRYSLDEPQAADKIEDAVDRVLKDGYRTKDVSSYGAKEVCTTSEMGSLIASYIS